MQTVMPQTSKLMRLIAAIDRFSERLGQAIAWLVLAMMLITCAVVVIRYGFNGGSIALQESVTYLHGCVFLLGMGYALKHNAHVRVDIFYRAFSPRKQAWVNSLGTILFTLPFALAIFGLSLGFVDASWSILERSPEAGGIPAIFLLKTLIPAGAFLLVLQAIAELLRSISVFLGYTESLELETGDQI